MKHGRSHRLAEIAAAEVRCALAYEFCGEQTQPSESGEATDEPA